MLMEILEKQEDLKLEQYVTDIKNSVTLDSIVLAVFKFVLYIGSILLNEIVSERAKQHVERPNCPHCNSPLDRKDWLPRKITTLLGLIMWDRLAWRCPKGCKIGQITPYDKTLGIRPYQETSNEIKRMVCLLAVFVPFGIASLIFKKLTGIEICDKSIWNWVQEAGEKGIQKVNEELKKLNDGVDPELRELDPDVAELPMVIGGDGVTVPFRPNEGSPKGKTKWCIVNVGIIARIGSKLTKTGKKISIIVRRRVIAVLDNINIFKNHMHLEALKEGVNNAKQVAWLSDGGPGFWGVFRDLFSKLKNVYGILDFYHAAQNGKCRF
jgi:hypothetical protein